MGSLVERMTLGWLAPHCPIHTATVTTRSCTEPSSRTFIGNILVAFGERWESHFLEGIACFLQQSFTTPCLVLHRQNLGIRQGCIQLLLCCRGEFVEDGGHLLLGLDFCWAQSLLRRCRGSFACWLEHRGPELDRALECNGWFCDEGCGRARGHRRCRRDHCFTREDSEAGLICSIL